MRVEVRTTPEDLLRVDDNFATLLDVGDDGSYGYELTYFVSPVQALRSSASIVRLTVRTSLPVLEAPTFSTIDNKRDPQKLVDNILQFASLSKDVRRSNVASAVMVATSDITARVGNHLTSLIADVSVPPASVMGTQRVIDVRQSTSPASSNSQPAVLHTPTAPTQQAQFQGGVQAASLDMIFGSRTDPSTVATNAPPTSVSTARSFSGTLTVNQRQGTSNTGGPSTGVDKSRTTILDTAGGGHQDVDTAFSPGNVPTAVPVVSDMPRVSIRNTKVLRVPGDQVGLNDFFISFDLVDSLGSVIESITKKVPHNLLVRIFNVPHDPPRVCIGSFQFPGRNVIELQQVDARGDRVRLYRRKVSHISSDVSEETYEQVAELDLKKSAGIIKFLDVVNNSSVILYRAISVGSGGVQGFEFSNAVSPATNPLVVKRRLSASINARCVKGGVAVSVTNASVGPTAMRLLRRDRTLNETAYSVPSVDDPVRPISKGLQNASFLDKSVQADHIYEYSLEFIFPDGSIRQTTAYAILLYISVVVGVADISVSNVSVVRNNDFIDVQFDVRSNVIQSNLDAVKTALEKQGLGQLFSSNLTDERDKLEKLIAHNIMRINMTTGENEDFGTFTGTRFSDVAVGAANAVKQLKAGTRYRYVITTLLRAAETMFDDFKKPATDTTTGKSYVYDVAKFKHPISLEKGTLVSRSSLVSNHPEDDFAHGRVGNPQEVDVSIDIVIPQVNDVVARRIDRTQVNVSWRVDGELSMIEHFIITKELLGTSYIVGKAHHVSSGNTFEFIDRLSSDDIGELTYSVVPVLGDFTHGAKGRSNKLVVKDGRT